ncbi:MAG: DUF11 domain-containing protein, partial [Caldilineaceae bacterium]|nr:DUF11 domain-containing protein [Caldilineaceae bacterium]
TITIVNGGTGAASGVTMIDPIPGGTTYVSGSATSTAPTVTYDNTNNWVKWTGNLAVGDSVTITFKVRVNEQIDCGSAIYNKASLVNANNEPVQFAEVRT